jgi:SulP family sulfate permease
MPDAVLSAVVFLICVHLIDVEGMQKIYRERPAEFWVALITAATVVIVGVMQGIVLAMFLSLVSHTRHGYRPKNAVMVPARSEGWKAQPVATQAQFLPGLLIYRFTHGMYYANAEVLSQEVTRLVQEANPALSWFCIDAAAVDDVDYTAAAVLLSLYDLLQKYGVKLVFSEVSPEVFVQLKRSGITELISQDAFHRTTGAVVRAYRQKLGTPA